MWSATTSTRTRRRAVIAVAIVLGTSIIFFVGLAAGAPPGLLLLAEGVSLAFLLWYLVASPSAAPLPSRSPLAWSADPAERVGQLLRRIERLTIDELRLLAVRPLDEGAHEAARAEARRAGVAAGLGSQIESAETTIDGFVDRTLGSRSFDPTFVGLAWRHEPTAPDDRIKLARTLSDAALAVAVRDLVDEATVDELLGPLAALVDPPPEGSTASA